MKIFSISTSDSHFKIIIDNESEDQLTQLDLDTSDLKSKPLS